MELLKVDDNGTVKDQESGAVLNTDVAAYKRYKMERERTKSLSDLEDNLTDMQAEVNSLRTDIAEIKTLLRQLANGDHHSS